MRRIDKLNKIAKSKKLDAFLVTSPASVNYFSGYFYNFETGPSPFHLLPSALLVIPGKGGFLILADNELDQAHGLDSDMVILHSSSYVYTKPLDFTKQFLSILHKLITSHKLWDGHIGIEANSLPFIIGQTLGHEFQKIGWVDIGSDIARIRAVKDRDEIEGIRAAATLCDIGQTAVLKNARPGISELNLFALVRAEMEAAAGKRVPLMADFISGARTSSGGGGPTNKLLDKGDLLLTDLTVCLDGYWGDSCSTLSVGQPDAVRNKDFERVKEALATGIEAIRPGIKALEIDARMRGLTGDYPHHGGHGVGVLYHEEPRIVAHNKTVLVPDMIIALEPAIYKKDYGIRLEHLVLVTETGSEILTQFKHCFTQDNQPDRLSG
ncbi:M24 family metallopeptidase [Flavitalea flava]